MIIYAAVVCALGMGWFTLKALQVSERMRLQALQPLMVTYTAVACACRKGWMAVGLQPEMATPQWSALEESAKWQ